ncbi:MAG: DUF2167 domain-containing protein, partial [Rhodospirillales bacterium]|nr:DUF2167 domain-containing protein [Rhodospirillales bacterium]
PPAATPSAAERERALASAWEAASQAAKRGPATVALIDQGSFAVPAGAVYIPLPQAAALMRAMGNTVRPNMLGVLASESGDDWMAVLTFVKEGHIKDDDAREWNADDLLASLREGTAAGNEERRRRGFPGLELIGWIEKPAYDAATQRLVWSVNARQEGAAPDADRTVNYNTYVLGREGYFSLNFLTSEKLIPAQKPVAHGLLAGLSFVDGKRYADFDASTDKVAAYGLAALVGGAALKKFGLFAVIGAFLLKFSKLGLLLLIPVLWIGRKLFTRRGGGQS